MEDSPSKSASSSPSKGPNPLAFLGLRRVGDEDDEPEAASPGRPLAPGASPSSSKGGVELNRRGLPARKRKRNSLIYGDDEVVSIPVRSPRKKKVVASAEGAASPVLKKESKEEEEKDKAKKTPSAAEERPRRRQPPGLGSPRSRPSPSTPPPRAKSATPAKKPRGVVSLTSTVGHWFLVNES